MEEKCDSEKHRKRKGIIYFHLENLIFSFQHTNINKIYRGDSFKTKDAKYATTPSPNCVCAYVSLVIFAINCLKIIQLT